MKPFSLLIKPASADCNLRCAYCFYLDRCELYPETASHRMPSDVLERMISGYMATPQRQYTFGWQGGEPTLMGVDFFRDVIKLQKKYGRPGAVVANGLQTNATLIDDEFAEHFAKLNFLLGVSIDGPAEIHDRYRLNAAGRTSHADVMRGVECLKRHKVEFNALVLVSQANVSKPKEVYRYLQSLDILHHQFIPCVEFDDKGQPLPFAISGKEWGEFLIGIFDEWIRGDTRRISVRLFDSILSMIVDKAITICHMGRNCCQYFVVEHNGDVYPCDFFVRSDLKLGNIMTGGWDEFAVSQTYQNFGSLKSQWNEECANCDCLSMCAGDCLKHRLPVENDPATLSWLCEGWKMFYRHAMPGFKRISGAVVEQRRRYDQWARQQQMAKRPRPNGPAVADRNAHCPCGSGKKYKKCCGG